MIRGIGVLLLSAFFIHGNVHARAKVVYTVSTGRELDSILSIPVDSIYVLLLPGDYNLRPKTAIDTCVLSKRHKGIKVPYTYGLRITGKFVSIVGAPNFSSMIFTHAGYGIYFDGCEKAVISGLIITGGARDMDSLATDAAIVVKNSRVDILNNIIFDNIGDSVALAKTHQGIMGICCREDGYARIYKNQIARNSWDGISLYKNGMAQIRDNLIDGVDTYEASRMLTRFYIPQKVVLTKGGRGSGIFLTRNSFAVIDSNIIKRYNKGLCIYVNAFANISNNVIENIEQWGIVVWDADSGRPVASIRNNVVYKTGACGIGLTRYREPKNGECGCLKDNIVVETAQDRRFDPPDKYCFQCALAVHAVPDSFVIANNVFYQNQWLSPCSSNDDMMLPQFIDVLQRRYPYLANNWFAGYSEFIQRFYLNIGERAEK